MPLMAFYCSAHLSALCCFSITMHNVWHLGGHGPPKSAFDEARVLRKNVTEFAKIVFDAGFLSKTVPRAGSEVVRIPVDPLRFLTR